jgi:hypothetical protein
VSAASETNRPLLVMLAKNVSGPPPLAGPVGGQIFVATAMINGTAASTASPAQFRRRPKISMSSER